MEVQLPIANYIFRSDASRAFADAIMGNHADYKNWICDSHIGIRAAMDLYYSENKINIRTIGADVYGVPFLKCSRLSRCIVKNLEAEAMIDFLCGALSNGFYIILDCNERYIPGRWCSDEEDFRHSELIHGYNSETRMFSVYGFTDRRRFETVFVPFDRMVKSIEFVPDIADSDFFGDLNNLIFVSVDNGKNYNFSVSNVKKCIKQYLTSCNLVNDLDLYLCSVDGVPSASWLDKYYRVYTRENLVYGFRCYDVLFEWFDRNGLSSLYADNAVNSLYAILEHKQCMKIRFECLSQYLEHKRGEIEALSKCYENDIYEVAMLLVNAWLKYTMTERESSLKAVTDLITRLKTSEYTLLEKLITLL